MLSKKLFFSGGAEQVDSLYAAFTLYVLSQSKIVKNAVLSEEKDKALVRIAHIEELLKQIEDL